MALRKRVVVVGAGIGGLAATMALSRLGYEVVVVERDDTPMPADVEGAFDWERRGAPQVRHTHGFPALIRVLLRDRYPDVLQALRDAGVVEVGIMPPSVSSDAPNYDRDAEDLQVLSCRRTTLEWVFRRCALAEESVKFRVGVGAEGLLVSESATGGAPLEVRGVRLDDGTDLAADIVVASTGRRGDVPGWFAAHGVDIAEDEHPTGTIYLSRFYRTDRDDAPTGYRGGGRAGLGLVLAGADNGTYSATLSIDASDAELRAHLLDPDRFEAVLPLFREMEAAVQCGGEPITPVQAMGGLINRIRRFVDADGAPLAHGFFAIGDAHTCTNPVHGRGSSLAVLQAVLLADALDAHPDDPAAAARAYEAASAAKVEPWYHVSLMADTASAPRDDTAAPPESGASRAEPAPPQIGLSTLMRVAGAGDPVLAVLVARTISLLATPQEVFGDPDVIRRIEAAVAVERPVDPNRVRRPPVTREDILAAGAAP